MNSVMSRSQVSTKDQLFRLAMIAFGIGLMILASFLATGCSSMEHGKRNIEAKNAAQKRIDTLKAANEYQMGVQALTAGDLEKASKHGDRALSLNEGVTRSWVLRARIMMEKGEMQGANDSLARAEQLSPTDVETQYYMGLLAERVARREEALKRYLRASELDTDNAQYPIAAAEMMIDLGQVDEAEKFLIDRQTTFQHTAGIQQTLGHIQLLRNNYQAAADSFNQARLLAPNSNEIVEDLARALFLAGSYADAEQHLARLTKDEVFKQRRDLLHMRAKCLINLDRNAEARDLLVAMTRQEGGNADVEAWIQLGQVAYTLRDNSRVRVSFSRLIAMVPERPEGYVLKGLYMRRTGDLTGAEDQLRKAVELETDANRNSENLVVLGLILESQKKTRSAQAMFDKAAKLDPSNKIATRLASDPGAAATLAAAQDD